MLRTCSEPDLVKVFELDEDEVKKSNDKKISTIRNESPRLGNTKKSNDSVKSTMRLAKSLEDLSKVKEENGIEQDEEIEVIKLDAVVTLNLFFIS